MGVIKVKRAIVINNVGARRMIGDSESAVAPRGIQVFSRRAGEQADLKAAGILGEKKMKKEAADNESKYFSHP